MLDTSYAAVYRAWLNFRKGKQSSQAIDAFASSLEANIFQLSREIRTGHYRHGGYLKVTVQEKKRRNLAVTTVRDRVVHRLLYNYLVNKFDRSFDYDVWSCRKNKGLHKCLDRTKTLLNKYSQSYIWRADVQKFFDSVNHEILLEAIMRKISDSVAVWLCQETVISYSLPSQSYTGIPIGNLTSQIFSNIYLNEFDRFVRRQLKPLAYLRYGDDFVLFAPTRRRAYQFQCKATQFLYDNLSLSINHRNNIVVPAADGLKFLGHEISTDSYVVDKHTTRSVLKKVNASNAASYKALYSPPSARQQLDWILLDEVNKIIDNGIELL